MSGSSFISRKRPGNLFGLTARGAWNTVHYIGTGRWKPLGGLPEQLAREWVLPFLPVRKTRFLLAVFNSSLIQKCSQELPRKTRIGNGLDLTTNTLIEAQNFPDMSD